MANEANEKRSRIAAQKFNSLENIEEHRPVIYKFLTETEQGKELCKELFSEDIQEEEKPIGTKPLMDAIDDAMKYRDAQTMQLNNPKLWDRFEHEPGGLAILSQIFPEVIN